MAGSTLFIPLFGGGSQTCTRAASRLSVGLGEDGIRHQSDAVLSNTRQLLPEEIPPGHDRTWPLAVPLKELELENP